MYQWPVTAAGHDEPVVSPRVFGWTYVSSAGCLTMQILLFGGGGLLLTPFHRTWGIALLLGGVALVALACIAEQRYTITCDTGGFTVEGKRRVGRKRRDTYTWGAVRATHYREIRYAAYFAVSTDRGRAFEVRRAVPAPFHALIATFSVMTPHLPYVWQAQGPGSSRQWRYGWDRYRKVTRLPPVGATHAGGDV